MPQRQRFWRLGRRLRERQGLLTILPFVLCLFVLFVVPTARLLARAFLEPAPGIGQFATILGDPLYWQVFWTTLRISVIVTIVCLVLGYPVAYLAAHSGPLTRNIVFAFVLVPFWTSTLVRLYGWTVILQRTGIVNQVLSQLGIISAPLRLMSTEGAVI